MNCQSICINDAQPFRVSIFINIHISCKDKLLIYLFFTIFVKPKFNVENIYLGLKHFVAVE